MIGIASRFIRSWTRYYKHEIVSLLYIFIHYQDSHAKKKTNTIMTTAITQEKNNSNRPSSYSDTTATSSHSILSIRAKLPANFCFGFANSVSTLNMSIHRRTFSFHL